MSTRTARALLACTLTVACTPAAARAQTSDQAASARPGPSFEVASVRRCTEDLGPLARGGVGGFSPGRLTLNCQTVSGLIQMAYLIFQNDTRNQPGVVVNTPVEGGPGWINSERYTITATADGAASEGMMRGAMFRALLEDRFKLRIRRESYEVPIYALTIAKGGPKLQPFQPGSCIELPTPLKLPLEPLAPGQRYCKTPGLPGGASLSPEAQLKAVAANPNRVVEWEGITLDVFANRVLNGMSTGLGRRVIDKTGLTGKFNIRLEYAPPAVDPSLTEFAAAQAAAGEPTAPPIETALQEQLGLKLESARGEGQRFVIESIERPSEN